MPIGTFSSFSTARSFPLPFFGGTGVEGREDLRDRGPGGRGGCESAGECNGDDGGAVTAVEDEDEDSPLPSPSIEVVPARPVSSAAVVA